MDHQAIKPLRLAQIQMESGLPLLAHVTPTHGDREGTLPIAIKEVAIPNLPGLEIGLVEEGLPGCLYLQNVRFARTQQGAYLQGIVVGSKASSVVVALHLLRHGTSLQVGYLIMVIGLAGGQ